MAGRDPLGSPSKGGIRGLSSPLPTTRTTKGMQGAKALVATQAESQRLPLACHDLISSVTPAMVVNSKASNPRRRAPPLSN
jgi:hypothetical protein